MVEGGGTEVRRRAERMAALRKWEFVSKSGRERAGSGCVEGVRKGGGTSRRVSGW